MAELDVESLTDVQPMIAESSLETAMRAVGFETTNPNISAVIDYKSQISETVSIRVSVEREVNTTPYGIIYASISVTGAPHSELAEGFDFLEHCIETLHEYVQSGELDYINPNETLLTMEPTETRNEHGNHLAIKYIQKIHRPTK